MVASIAVGIFVCVTVALVDRLSSVESFIGILTLATLIASISMVCSWATDGSSQKSNRFMNKPDWDSNPLPYHPIMMISLVYSCLLIRFVAKATSTTSMKLRDKVVIVILNILTITGIIIGLLAINKWRNLDGNNIPSLTTVHSWIGVAAVAFISAALLAQAICWISEQFEPKATRVFFSCVSEGLNICSALLISLAIGTGISNQLGRGYCSPQTVPGKSVTSLTTLDEFPLECLIANGLGISATFGTLCIAALVKLRLHGSVAKVPQVESAKHSTTSLSPRTEYEPSNMSPRIDSPRANLSNIDVPLQNTRGWSETSGTASSPTARL